MISWLSNLRMLCFPVCSPVLVAALCCTIALAEETPTSPSAAADHPLSHTVRYAKSRAKFIREHVRDYSCRLIKRERIDGKLQDFQFAKVKVRCEERDGESVVTPFSVYMQYLAPKKMKDRRVLFIEGQNDGQVLVRKGGNLMKFLKVRIDPNGAQAKRESRSPITDVGFGRMIERLISRTEDDMRRDPKGDNTKVSYFRDAKVNDRKCTHIKIVHPKRDDELDYHIASLYIDNELQVPIRLVSYLWPDEDDGKPLLKEEFTYVGLKLNVGLTDSDFSESQLSSSPSKSDVTAVGR